MRLQLLLGMLLCLTSGAAAAVDPGRFDDLHWRNLGPFRGGRVLAVAGVPNEREHFYFGAVNGGVWETRDAGRTWVPIFDAQPIGTIGALALAPSNPKVIYVGSGEANMRSSIAQGNGMYRSADGGASWSRIGLADSQQIGRILVHPADPDLVYVAALGHPYGPNSERGVFRSRDGGRQWERVLFRDADTGAIDLAFQPDDPRVIYAALWQTRRTPWHVYPPSNGPGSGLYKSTDGGDTWRAIGGNGLPARHGRIGLAVARTQPQRVYAMVDAEPGGVFRSDDGGAHWIALSRDDRIWQRGWYFGGIVVDPANADRVYALNTNLFRSDDAGRSFTLIKGSTGGDDYHELWIDAADPQRQILGVDQGAVVTLNGGRTWSSWHNQSTAQFYRLATDNRFPYWVYGPQQDSGAVGLPSRSAGSPNGINLTQFREITAGGESHNMAPDPLDPQIVYGGTVDKLDLRSMQTRTVDPTLALPDYYRSVWTMPLVFSLRDPRVLYFANQRVWRTADGGAHWEPISPDLSRVDPGIPPNLDPATAALDAGRGPRRGVVYAIAPSRLADHSLWVGTDDGLVWRTRDEGAHWSEVTPRGLGPWSKVAIIDASPFDAEAAYAAVDRHRLDDFHPYIYRTRDGGANWDLVVDGIPDHEAVNVVRADPQRQGLLYAGTERGVHLSYDDGAHWQSLQLGLPVTSVRDIEVKGNDLVIATHGRGFWILDDISPLRQAPDVAPAATAWLYQPADAHRVRAQEWTGTPLPKDEPRAQDPPEGAYIDYLIAGTPREPVLLEIHTDDGTLLRRYSSAEAPPGYDPDTTLVAPEWFRPAVALSATPGMHRFVWPLRRVAAAPLDVDGAYSNGVWVPPGEYCATLVVDGQRLERAFTVRPDPRVTLEPADYAAQYALALQVEAVRAEVARIAEAVGPLTEALADRRGRSQGGTRRAITALQDRTYELAGTYPATNQFNGWWRAARNEHSLRFVTETLDKLQLAVDGADAAPSPDARAGLAKIQPIAMELTTQWGKLVASDLAVLNLRLAKAGLDPIALPARKAE